MTKPADGEHVISKSELDEQVELLSDQLRNGEINIHQFMKLLGMVYGDYLDFHPEEHPYYNDRERIEQFGKK